MVCITIAILINHSNVRRKTMNILYTRIIRKVSSVSILLSAALQSLFRVSTVISVDQGERNDIIMLLVIHLMYYLFVMAVLLQRPANQQSTYLIEFLLRGETINKDVNRKALKNLHYSVQITR